MAELKMLCWSYLGDRRGRTSSFRITILQKQCSGWQDRGARFADMNSAKSPGTNFCTHDSVLGSGETPLIAKEHSLYLQRREGLFIVKRPTWLAA